MNNVALLASWKEGIAASLSRSELFRYRLMGSKGGSLNDFSAKEKSSINRLIKNLNRQRTVTIAETNEIVVKIDATLLILY